MFHGNDQVDSSTGTGNTETVDVTWTGEKPLYVKVFGYGDATGPYTIDVVTQGGVNLGDPCDDRNETMETALEIPRGVFNGLRICANDVDWFRIPATTGAFTATVEWSAGQGPLQVQMMRSNGSTTGTVTQEARAIRIESTAGLRFLKVSALGGAQASYVLRIE
jgi:hypothetical protein